MLHDLTPDRWQQVSRLLDDVLDLPPGERSAFLDVQCAGDPELRAQVEAMLAADAAAGTFLQGAAAEQAAPLLEETPTPSTDRLRIGPYRTLEPLGYGGMGVVYLAERADGAFEQTVALKLVRRSLAHDEAFDRFRVERQVLARLQHPGIARLYDGGMTDEGEPYFAMEVVEGTPLTDYCDAHQLPVEERLRLVAAVGEAVQHAHRHLVVHRDLKPSNILVTPEGQVKLLDFGIAKVLDEEEGLTRTGLLLMTPEYAAPEQVRGEAVTTATDVYALGLLLYELLTGQPAHRFEQRTPEAMARTICETPVERPSTAVTRGTDPETAKARQASVDHLRQTLAGDLDAICQTALRKEPTQRYASAEAFVDDVKRFLANQPVTARPPTLGYRLQTFVRRHRAGVAAGAAVVTALVLGLLGTAWQARVAAAERDRAVQRAAEAEAVTAFMTDLFEASDPYETLGDTLTAPEILVRGVERAEALAEQPVVQARTLFALGEVHRRLGQYAEAEALHEEALALRRAYLEPTDADLAASLNRLGITLLQQGGHEAAEALHREALAIAGQAGDTASPEAAYATGNLAWALREAGRYEEAERYNRRAIALWQQRPPGEERAAGLANAYLGLNQTLQPQNKLDEAEAALREALSVWSARSETEHPEYARTLNELADLLDRRSAYAEAEPVLREALAINRATLGPEHPYTAQAISNLGMNLSRQGKHDAAEPLYREALALQRGHFGEQHLAVAQTQNNLGSLLQDAGRLDEAQALFEASLASLVQVYGEQHPYPSFLMHNLGRLHQKKEEWIEAERLLREALTIQEATLSTEHPNTAASQLHLGHVLLDAGQPAEAEPFLREARAAYDTLHETDHRMRGEAMLRLGMCLAQQDRQEEAAPLLAESLRILRTVDNTPAWLLDEAEAAVAALQGPRLEATAGVGH